MAPIEAERKIRNEFEDHYGLIVQSDGNGGDCAAHTGMFWFAIWSIHHEGRTFQHDFYTQDRLEFSNDYFHLEVMPGILRRHPDAAPDAGQPGVRDFAYWNNTKVFSRDQWVRITIALGVWEMTDRLGRLFKEHLKRFFFHQNGDLTGPQHFGVWIRAFQADFLWPILWITDFFLAISVLVDLIKYKLNPDDTADVVNGVMMILQAESTLSTPFSTLAKWLMKKRNPKEAFAIYFDPKTNAPPFDGLYNGLLHVTFG